MEEAAIILKNIDKLLSESRLEEAEKYMLEMLEKAKGEGKTDTGLSVLNELVGFYRDTGKMSRAIECCTESERLLDEAGVGKTPARAAAYLNCANAYRAAGFYDQAFSYFKKCEEVLEICGDDYLYSNYYNNLSLLHQQKSNFEEAVECLKKALYIADEKMHDEIKTAISRTNLASSLLQLGRKEEAEEVLLPAIKIFSGRTPSDFHYSAALSAMGNLKMLEGRLPESALYFEQALSEIELHMGKNNFYTIVTDNLANVYKMLGGKPAIKGLDLCEKYFNLFFKPVLEREFKDLIENISCGLCGEGSECLGFDDEISADHDFGPGFCIWVNDKVSDMDIMRLQKAYDLLPKTFMGFTRINTPEAAGRTGVIKIADFLKKVTGFDHIPKGINEWQYTVDENLVMGVNGRIFMDKNEQMHFIRTALLREQPMYVYYMKLGMQLELMAKHGQYAFERALKRNDLTAAFIAKAEFIKAAMRACHIMSFKYAPYSKWLFKSLEGLREYSQVSRDICLLTESGTGKDNLEIIENICLTVREKLYEKGILDEEEGDGETYLAVMGAKIKGLAQKTIVADKIVDLEWALFDKVENEGGRANCQDDWGTFSIMRRSQYYSYPMQLLQTIYADFTEKMQKGENVIAEKYGFMMESTAPEEFAKIKASLPEVNPEKKAIINEIARIQVGMMESFAEKYPKLATNARVIHEEEDTPYMTSYETYLKGELQTYHDDTLMLYGRFIAEAAGRGVNPVKSIMNKTTFFYGYESLEACENALF